MWHIAETISMNLVKSGSVSMHNVDLFWDNKDAINIVKKVFHIEKKDIINVSIMKKGMTNQSFVFEVEGKRFLIRVPGEGTDKLINRLQEAKVYDAISGHGFCDAPIYLNPQTGYKITKFLDGARVCDANCALDLEKCMAKLRELHLMKLKVEHSFDLFGQIDFYQKLWNGKPSMYEDYDITRQSVFRLKTFINGVDKDWCLTHIDAVSDNFLFCLSGGVEEIQLTDWEYSGMQDPHVDIAMFCLYSMFDKSQVDGLIDLYFQGLCDHITRVKIYAYISAGGLLWSNWCEYKHDLGIDFGDYSSKQYCFAKEYYKYVMDEINGKLDE